MADYDSIAVAPDTGTTTPVALQDINGEKAQVVVLDVGDFTSGKDPLTKGQKTAANSLSFVPASDATFPTTSAKPGTATGSTPAMTEAASATILAANTLRLGAIIYNPRTVDLLINLGAAAAAATAVARVGPRQSYVLPILYTGLLTGRLASAGDDGNIYVQELTA